MSLGKIQKDFKDHMLRPASRLSDCSSAFTSLFKQDHIPTEARLKVYHNNIVGSLSDILCATFPMIQNLVGVDFLKSMCRAFIFENPPKQGCMHHYGENFDKFIKTYEPAQPLPYLADVATLELALNAAYFAQDDTPLAPDALAKIPQETLGDVVLSLRPSATLISSTYPLTELQAFCLENGNKNPPNMMLNQKTHVLIIRPLLEVNMISLTSSEHKMLDQLQFGIVLSEALDKTLELYPDFNFTAFLQKHIALQTFSSLEQTDDQ